MCNSLSHTPPLRRPARLWISIAALAAAGLMAGCGGVIDDGEGFLLPVLSVAAPAASDEPAPASAVPASPVGQALSLPSDPAAEPADQAAHTRAGLYLKRGAAEAAGRERSGDVVWLDVGCCAGDSADDAVLIAYGVQAAGNLANDAPFFVTGGDLRLAARIADRLLADGRGRPYLVTP